MANKIERSYSTSRFEYKSESRLNGFYTARVFQKGFFFVKWKFLHGKMKVYQRLGKDGMADRI